MKLIDLRSDTVTKPTEKMRKAMYKAEVGDDVYRDDPTIIELEYKAAKKLGKEAALFVPSGTMGNQVAVLTHTQRGEEIILEENSHIFINEVGGIAILAGVQAKTLKGVSGALNVNDVENAIREEDIHYPKTSLICIENTHNKAGGKVIPIENMKSIYELGKKHSIPIHLDGARIFNASTYLNVDVKEIAQFADSINFCLSKGLCAPIGSVLVGSNEFINKARKNRKLLGGGMRQAGILAAAGIIALDEMTLRLQEDHENAKNLAEGLAEIPGIHLDVEGVQTNIIMVDVSGMGINGNQLADSLKKYNILINGSKDGNIRLVTHAYINKDDIDKVLKSFKNLI
ncbi:MAG TPA: low-specificity L-threonine aldolase [Eubacteriaceae bacterium]|jgi:threonine aldolase|nr:low-specificity L-threonine aldolase [Eubacteriaceae bacterium]